MIRFAQTLPLNDRGQVAVYDSEPRSPAEIEPIRRRLNVARLECMSRPDYRNAAELAAELAERAAMWGME